MWRKSLHQDHSSLLPFELVQTPLPRANFLPGSIPSSPSLSKHHSLFAISQLTWQKSLNLAGWRIEKWWNKDRERKKERNEKHITPKRIWTWSKGKNHFHISQQTTDSKRKEGDQFQQRSRLKQTRHCAFPVWTRAQPRPVTCTAASTVSLLLAPVLCETELGHHSLSHSLLLRLSGTPNVYDSLSTSPPIKRWKWTQYI